MIKSNSIQLFFLVIIFFFTMPLHVMGQIDYRQINDSTVEINFSRPENRKMLLNMSTSSFRILSEKDFICIKSIENYYDSKATYAIYDSTGTFCSKIIGENSLRIDFNRNFDVFLSGQPCPGICHNRSFKIYNRKNECLFQLSDSTADELGSYAFYKNGMAFFCTFGNKDGGATLILLNEKFEIDCKYVWKCNCIGSIRLNKVDEENKLIYFQAFSYSDPTFNKAIKINYQGDIVE